MVHTQSQNVQRRSTSRVIESKPLGRSSTTQMSRKKFKPLSLQGKTFTCKALKDDKNQLEMQHYFAHILCHVLACSA